MANAGKCVFVFSEKLSFAARISPYECLAEIFKKVDSLVGEYRPNYAAIEGTIFVQNYRVAQTLGAVKGAVIAALARHPMEICEYPPLRVKKAVTGAGRASKVQVMRTVKGILGIGHEISSDEADAMAAACCLAWTFKKSR
jgi:crossover junction endodeoxyribonuclease RuvC